MRTSGTLAVDVFHVKDVGTAGQITEARMAMLKESLERLCCAGRVVSEGEGWELNQHLGDTATLRAHIMVRVQRAFALMRVSRALAGARAMGNRSRRAGDPQ